MKKTMTEKEMELDMLLDDVNRYIEVEISEYKHLTLDEIIRAVTTGHPNYKFNRTEPRYQSCIMAIFERIG